MSTTTHAALVESYLAMWNETGADVRHGLVEQVMTDDATYV